MRKIICFIGIFFLWLSTPSAAVLVKNKVLQKGLYLSPECAKLGKRKLTAECFCESDIRYPELSGLTNNVAQTRLNIIFAEYAKDNRCPGKRTKLGGGDMRSESSLSFEITHQSSRLLGIVTNLYAYTAHAAHGGEAVESRIIDTETGKLLTPADIYGDNLAKVNQYIFDKLKAMPDIFPEEVDALKDKFILSQACNSCSVLLTGEGVKVVFRQYAVAPYASGMPEVIIPSSFIVNSAMISALTKK